MGRPLSYYGRFGLPALFLAASAMSLISPLADISFLPIARAEKAADNLRADENDDTLLLTGLQNRFEYVAKKVSPCVVAISAAATPLNTDEGARTETINPEKLEGILDRGIRTVGTGFIIDSDGYILTNEHVVGESEQLWITLDSGKVYPAIIVGSDPRQDLAVLKIPAKGLTTARFAQAGSVRRGQWTIALGNPYGLAQAGEMAMSVGVVSAVDRSLPKLASKENRIYSNLIQTTAQINPGNSGGPLFDLTGNVIAINTAVILPQHQTNGIGFAMPIDSHLLKTIDDLKQGKEVIHGYLGVMVVTPTAAERRDLGIRDEVGARVDSIDDKSPASASGLKLDDIIVALNDEPIRDSDHFVREVGDAPVEQPAVMKVNRDGKLLDIKATLGRRNGPQTIVSRETQRMRWRGLLLGPIPAIWELPGKRPSTGLLVISVDPASPLTKSGVQQGSVITTVAGKAVKSLTDLQQIVNDTPQDRWSVEVLKASDTVASTGNN